MNKNMKGIFSPSSVILLLFPLLSGSARVLKFSDNRRDGSGAKFRPSRVNRGGGTAATGDLTVCVEFYLTLIRYVDIFSSEGDGGWDLGLLMPDNLNTFELAFKNNWYIAYSEIEPFNWSAFCLSYHQAEHKVG